MEKTYIVSSTKRLDFVDNYGNVSDSVYFEGEKDAALWSHSPKTTVEKGTQVYGIIETRTSASGKEYRKFKKVQQENAVQGHSQALQGPSNAGDGARQGMAINNASEYVISMLKGERLNPDEFAQEILEYAKAIYTLDLTAPTKAELEEIKDILD